MPSPLGLKDTFTEEGYWWISGGEDNQVAGTLTYDAVNGAELTLLGITGDIVSVFNAALTGGDRGYATIYGVTKKGKPVTLLRTLNSNRQLNMPGIPTESWKSNLLVVGMHLADEKKQDAFKKSYLRFDGIEKWLGHRPLTDKYDLDEKSLTVTADKQLETHFADHADFKVTTAGTLRWNNDRETHCSIEAYSHLGIEPRSPKSLNWHMSCAVKLQELASLCTGHYLPLLSLELEGPVEELAGGTSQTVEVHVFARMMHPEAETRPKHEEPIISGPELIQFNPGAVQSWFDQYELFDPAISLFFTITGQREMFTNIRLLLAIQALEVFHRRTTSDAVMPEKEFETFYGELTKAIPDPGDKKMQEKLRSTCRYLNELSLGQRLRAIMSEITAAFDYTPPAFNKANLRKLVETRNYYTHFSPELEKRKLSGAEMLWASRRIVLLLSLLFLQRLGVGASDILPLLRRHQEFSRLWTTQGDPYAPQPSRL